VFHQREREHAEEVIDAVGAPVVVRLDDHLGVRGREKPVSEIGELCPEFLVVVDAAVEHHRQAELLVDHGLPARLRKIDDLETSMGEGHVPVLPHPASVRAPSAQPRIHASHGVGIAGPAGVAEFTGKSTHFALRSPESPE
jgi:hypothetical protein